MQFSATTLDLRIEFKLNLRITQHLESLNIFLSKGVLTQFDKPLETTIKNCKHQSEWFRKLYSLETLTCLAFQIWDFKSIETKNNKILIEL